MCVCETTSFTKTAVGLAYAKGSITFCISIVMQAYRGVGVPPVAML